MGQIENLVEWWIETNKLPFGYEGVESITKKLQSYIEVCDTLPIEDKIKALSFLYDKCDYILNSIASFMNYQLEYEPTDDEVWDFVEQEKKRIDINSDNLSQYENCIIDSDGYGGDGYFDESRLYEYVIDPMREQYREKNKDVSQWCDKIQDIQTNIYKRLSEEKEKQSFLNDVFKDDAVITATTIDDCLVNCDKGAIKRKLVPLLRGKKGESIAIVIEALINLTYTTANVKTLYNIFKNEFGITGSYSGVTHWTNAMRDKTKKEIPEVIDALLKVDTIMKELTIKG